MSPLVIHSAFWAAGLALLAAGAATDVRTRLIPNKLAIGVAALGLGYGLLARPATMGTSLLAALAVFFALAIPAYHKIIGGGDLKLIAAATFLVPPGEAGELLLEIVLAGGVLSCLYLAARAALANSASRPAAAKALAPAKGLDAFLEMERARIAAGSTPYALAILGGAVVHAAREFLQCSSAISCSP